jgi:hypothetical protein
MGDREFPPSHFLEYPCGGWLIEYPRLKRRHFDFAIFALVAIYGVGFVILLMARLHSGFCELHTDMGLCEDKMLIFLLGMGLFRAVWPCLIVTDIFCFIAGWVATWRGINL